VIAIQPITMTGNKIVTLNLRPRTAPTSEQMIASAGIAIFQRADGNALGRHPNCHGGASSIATDIRYFVANIKTAIGSIVRNDFGVLRLPIAGSPESKCSNTHAGYKDRKIDGAGIALRSSCPW
jgi:hypothetical protein